MSRDALGEPTPDADRKEPDDGIVGVVRGVALLAVAAGAAGSLGLMLRAGHPPLFRRVLFAGWVPSPFAALVLADRASKGWPVSARATLHGVMLVLVTASLAFYGAVVPMPPGTKPAFVFLVVPLGSWLILAIAVPAAVRLSRRPSRRDAGP